jgi:predicted nucleic acid-binding protein
LSYLIDTNVISELGKGSRCNSNVSAWYAGIDAEDIYLSVLVRAEIRKGIERARPSDLAKAEALETWLSQVRAAFAGRILPIDEEVADEWGRMAAQRSLKVVDSLLAATAKAKGLTLVTRNVADVAGLEAVVLNPFEQGVRH